ncbi:MAG: VOC family protein [Anaerolineae bacterium]
MTQIKSLNHVSIMVSDLEQARRFYVDILGLQPAPRPDERLPTPGLWLRCGESQVHLIVAETVERPELTLEQRLREGVGLAPHFSLEVEDVVRAKEELAKRGVLILGGPVPRPDGARQLFCHDPDGNLLELTSF